MSSRRIIMCATAAFNTNASNWGGRGGCLGFFVHLFSLGRRNSWRAGVVNISRGWGGGGTDSTQGDRICSSLGRQKVKHGLLLIIHILCSGGDECVEDDISTLLYKKYCHGPLSIGERERDQ
jgi:hypothetical protein